MHPTDYQRLILLTEQGDLSAAARLCVEARRRNDTRHLLLGLLCDPTALTDSDDPQNPLFQLFENTPIGPRLFSLISTALDLSPDLNLPSTTWISRLLDGHPEPRLLLSRTLYLNRHTLRLTHLKRLAHSPDLARLTALTIAKSERFDSIAPLVNSPLSARLHTLELRYLPLSRGDLGTLSHGPWPSLRSLEVVESHITPACLNRIARSNHFPLLRSLNLTNVPIDGDAVAVLRDSPLLAQLDHLSLIHCRISTQIGLLATSSTRQPHTLITLPWNPLPLPELAWLLAGRFHDGHLTIYKQTLSPESVLEAGDRLRFQTVKTLSIHHCAAPNPDTWPALLSRPGLADLTHLDLSNTPIAPQSLPHLTSPAALPNVERLTLSACCPDPSQSLAFCLSLARCALPQTVRTLDLSQNPLSDGFDALLRAPWLSQLDDLNLSHCGLTPADILAFAQHPDLRLGKRLNLSGCPIGDEGAVALALSPSMRGTLLICERCAVSVWGSKALRLSPYLKNADALDLNAHHLPTRTPTPDTQRIGWAERLLYDLLCRDKLHLTPDARPALLAEAIAARWPRFTTHATPGRALSHWLLDRDEVEDLFVSDDVLARALQHAPHAPSVPVESQFFATFIQAACTLLLLLRQDLIAFPTPTLALALTRALSNRWLALTHTTKSLPHENLLAWLREHGRSLSLSPAITTQHAENALAQALTPVE